MGPQPPKISFLFFFRFDKWEGGEILEIYFWNLSALVPKFELSSIILFFFSLRSFPLPMQAENLPSCGTTIDTAPGELYEFTDATALGRNVTFETCGASFYDTKLAVFEVM